MAKVDLSGIGSGVDLSNVGSGVDLTNISSGIPEQKGFFETLRKKLNWGFDLRN